MTKIDYTTPATMTCDACGCQPFTGIQSPQDALATFYRTDEDLILCEECSQPGPLGPMEIPQPVEPGEGE